jgi:hypothetical protein
MRVRLVSLLVVTGLAAVATPAAHAVAPAEVRMPTCAPADDGTGSVTYVARMSAVPGTHRMFLRIRLFQKERGGRFERVKGEELDVWRKSHPGASAFHWQQGIENLNPGTVGTRVGVRRS